MNIIINENNLNNDEIENFSTKVRALLLDGERILVANYGNVMLLPGGSVDDNETVEQAIVRELKEEIGVEYQFSDFEYLATISFYQKDYPNRNGSTSNRLIKTHYFVGPYLGIKKQKLTEKEIKDKFQLNLIPLDDIEEQTINNQNTNPRNKFFQQELLKIIEIYKTHSNSTSKQKRISKM